MTSEESCEVIVAGYGPVGATLCALLGRAGVRTLVVEKAPDILLLPRAIALDQDALRILQRAGVDQTFERCLIPKVLMHSPFVGHFNTLDTDTTVDGHPKLVTFYQPDLERALRAEVARHPSVTVLLATTLRGFSDDGAGVRAQLLLADGSRREARASFLVGADGAGSQVRKAIGQEFTGRSYDQDWLIIDAQGVPGNIDHVEFLCDPRRPTPHMLAPGGRTRWEFMLAPGETREQMEQESEIRKLLAPWPEAAQARIERKAVYRFQARSCESYRKGRVFLAGDAAHVTPPFAGQGLVSGLRDAANLSWKLAAVVQGRAAPAVLDSYDRERRPHAVAMINLARGMGSMIMPRSVFKAILIQGLTKLLRLIPPLRRFLDSGGPKPKNVFREGLFVKAKGRLKHGALFPQLRIGDAATGILSDERLGPNLTLAGFGVEPRLDGELAQRWRALGHAIVMLPADPVFQAPAGWCVVLRPDRVVLHDGPAAEAARIARQALELMNTGGE